MTLTQANYEEVLLHLRHAEAAMRRLMAGSQDWAAKELVEIEFRELRDRVRSFARCQLGVSTAGRSPGRRGRKS